MRTATTSCNGLETTGQADTVIVFAATDQERFAELSGDRNPIHMDPQAARRTQAGQPVAHGVHGVLATLERLCAAGEPIAELAALKVQFPKFIYLDTPVAIRIVRRSDQSLKVELGTDELICAVLDLKFGKHSAPSIEFESADAAPLGGRPCELSFADAASQSGCLPISQPIAYELAFPRLCRAIGAATVESLARLSTIVGMQCPGLHSIFAGLSVRFTEPRSDLAGVHWRTIQADERFRRITMQVGGGGLEGEVYAFMRVKPIEQAPIAMLAAKVRPGEFATRTALIIGGSRGLGAVTAKLLAAGGSRVFLTYVAGMAEAERLVAEAATLAGTAPLMALRCDVHSDIAEQLDRLPPTITHIYYFATPRIAQQGSRTYERRRLDALLSVYADGFAAVAQWAASRISQRPLSVMYPSTVFVDGRPKGMTEYAMAKAAGEILAHDLAGALRISISTPRIPRVLTDQTASILAVETEDAAEVMLGLLRAQT